MTQSREHQVSLEATPFYHCYVRCVRRAYLCGDGHSGGENYDHRKQWIVSRIRFLSYIYAIDVCAYAVMSNHYHVVLHVDKARTLSWTNREVAERWLQLYSGNMLVLRWMADPESVSKAELEKVDESIETWRARLYDLGWFMRGINETIARMANEEEGIKGRFWEGRFKSQALLDEGALLSCMAYVDLNPVRAAMEDDVLTSDFTSIQARIYEFMEAKRQVHSEPSSTVEPQSIRQPKAKHSKDEKRLRKRMDKQRQLKADNDDAELPEAPLMPFGGSANMDVNNALPLTQEDYFDLVDSTGRAIRDDKRGYIPASTRGLIARLGINPDKWLEHIQTFHKTYGASLKIPNSWYRFDSKNFLPDLY